jgi:DNA topoisomerase I
MSKTKQPKTKTTTDGPKGRGRSTAKGGKQLVIVESPAKAKTINKYLGPEFIVKASVGHVRDLPERAPKGVKQPVPGVDLDDNFKPTYEVLSGKRKTMAELKKAAKEASEIWFATDLDREGEAIAWHLAQELGIEPADAKRVIFNAITKTEIQRAFAQPHAIDEYKVNAQQARRILDRIVGYQVSPLLWKKVQSGLSAGRVQSVAVRLIVEREREIRAFVPDETWRVTARLTLDERTVPTLTSEWTKFLATSDAKGNPPTIKSQNAWLEERRGIKAELVELGGEKFELTRNAGKADDPSVDLTPEVRKVVERCGLTSIQVTSTPNEDGKGQETVLRTVGGAVAPGVRYRVRSIETRRTTTRPSGPFITSSMQVAASTYLSFSADRTMRTAQDLYEGVEIPGEGQVGLITYMRTDSTHVSGEALNMVRSYISGEYGKDYLPESPNFFGSTNKAAQEAHEAIRPTDVSRTPESIRSALTEEQYKLYRLIWSRFVSCQMTSAEWDSTAVLLERDDQPTGAVFKATGRVLVFDGFYRVTGVPTGSDELTLPELAEKTPAWPFSIEPEQRFSNPPPRYTEASLVKTLESEGIGRPSTYAAIIRVIQDRGYVDQQDRRFFATDLGEVVTTKLIEGFPHLMDIGYTRQMEADLDKVEEQHTDWVDMLRAFYTDFADALSHAAENMTHAKAEAQPAPYACPKCGSRTVYRFGRNGRFLSCGTYPACDFAAPIDKEGRPRMDERVNVACPEDGSPMVLRTGRFGPFLASVNYPQVKCIVNIDKKGRIKYPSPPALVTELPCPKCGAPLNLRSGKRGPWLGCSKFPKCRAREAWTKVEPAVHKKLLAQLEAHDREHPQVVIRTLDGKVIPPGTPIAELLIPGGAMELAIHPDARAPARRAS